MGCYHVHEAHCHDVTLHVGDEELLSDQPFMEILLRGQVLIDLVLDTLWLWLVLEWVLLGLVNVLIVLVIVLIHRNLKL